MATDPSDMRRIRVDSDLWEAYAGVVGNGGRAADLRDYMQWRVENPDVPLPGRWRGPVKRVRKKPGPVMRTTRPRGES